MELNKLSGIYSIQNKLNYKQYIGHSKNVTFRWYYHLNNLVNGNHQNSKLQEDFNAYGLMAFNFSILELVEGKDNLIVREQAYLNELDFNSNYNIYNAINIKIPKYKDFTEYINTKWLVPSGITDIDKYRIYKQVDKDEIIEKVINYQLLDLPRSHITFNKIIGFMQDTLGYTIEDGRFRLKRKQFRYKLIIDFDEDYMEGVVNGN